MANSKLERRLSPFSVWALALGCIIGASAFLLPGTSFLPAAGPLGSAIAIGVGVIMMLIVALNYNYMIEQYPVAGGEYIYAQEIFGKNHGFFCAWFLGLSYLTIIGVNATVFASICRGLVGSLFQFGFHYSVAGYDVYGGEILLALSAIVLFGVVSICGIKLSGIFQTIMVLLLVGSVLILGGVSLIHNVSNIEILEPLFGPQNGQRLGFLSLVVIAPYLFLGFDTVPQLAEEFNFSPKKTKWILIVSIIFGGLLYIIINMATALTLPESYTNWFEYIEDINNLDGISSLPTFWAAKHLLGKYGLIMIMLAALVAALTGILGFYSATSRLLYSMARNHIMPSWFGDLHPKFNTPYKTILFIMIISLITPFLGRTAFGWLVSMSSIGASIGYGYTSFASFQLAQKNKKIGLCISGILGTIISIVLFLLLLIPIPSLKCSLSKESYVCLFIWIVMGVVFYRFSKNQQKDK